MRIIITVCLFIAALGLLAGCSRLARTSANYDAGGANDLNITLTREACYGLCPQYHLTINADGKVVFEGKKDTEVQGTATGDISKAKLDGLIKEFQSISFFDLEDAYDSDNCPSSATDFPTVVISLTLNGKTKKIRHDLGCSEDSKEHNSYPPGLKELENAVDTAAETKRWIGQNT